ncbi:hypothetical protein ACP70R_042969 [Stipagrostis hirtigluma subsp. patula]
MEDSKCDLDEKNEATEAQVYVSQDAQRVILAFLPGKAVVKFRRVCKFWRDCVEEPTFVDHHLNNAIRFYQSIACFTSLDRGLAHMYTFDPTTLNFKSAELVFSCRFQMSDPCNGLVCAYDLKGDADVLNPTTRKHLRLPVSEVKTQSLFSEYFVGFVRSTKEYKVVSVRHQVRFLTFEICDTGTMSWRTVRESADLLKTTKAVIVDDGMYWLLLHEASSVLSREILMLNLTDEKFSKVAIPDVVRNRDLQLFEGDGKLHLLSTPVDAPYSAVPDIWVLDWTQQFWVQLKTVAHRVPVGMSPFFLCKMKIFYGNQYKLICRDLLDNTASYINMPPGESLISCGTFVESFAPAVKGLVDSTVASYSSHLTESWPADPGPSVGGAGSSSTCPGQSSYIAGWSLADLVQSFNRAKSTTNMEWKICGK